MNEKELIEFRNLIKGCLIRNYQMSLNMHKEQERIEDLLRILDAHILKES